MPGEHPRAIARGHSAVHEQGLRVVMEKGVVLVVGLVLIRVVLESSQRQQPARHKTRGKNSSQQQGRQSSLPGWSWWSEEELTRPTRLSNRSEAHGCATRTMSWTTTAASNEDTSTTASYSATAVATTAAAPVGKHEGGDKPPPDQPEDEHAWSKIRMAPLTAVSIVWTRGEQGMQSRSLGYRLDPLIDSSSAWTCSKTRRILRTTALESSRVLATTPRITTTLSMMTPPRRCLPQCGSLWAEERAGRIKVLGIQGRLL
ncbi:hypothetical protein BDZ89DRAFT_1045779 [Hymenopellis radicata]|nr:hypothetical protein BDZ89DRAFT_1045779 [Hymenopellis radicata]